MCGGTVFEMGENVCVMSIFVFVLLIGLAGLMLFVRASGYLEATGPFGEPNCHSYGC